jgi:hypothetical protein
VRLLDDGQFKVKRPAQQDMIQAKFTSRAALCNFPETLLF